MTAQSGVPWYGTAKDWGAIITGAGQGAGQAMQSAAANVQSRKDAREAKRRTLANMLNTSLSRNRALYRVGSEYGDEMNDYQAKAIQDMARGFVEAYQGRPQI